MLNMAKAYKEINEILKYVPDEYVKRIPPQLIKVIEEKMDKNYEYKVEHIEDFENQEMLNETRALLAVIYREYFASDEEMERIKKEEKEFFEKENSKNRLENVLNKEKTKVVIEETETKELTKYEEKKWYQKIIEFIRKMKI